ncbi:MAG: DNA alkylation repair protein [Gammaproteobacteria bacterium]|nr:DNA alkylation repair protein [Gammaproteobacteria bacterium]
MNPLLQLQKMLRSKANNERARASARYLKTGPGEYGEGVRLLGVTAPELRKIAKQFCDLNLVYISDLIKSPLHEERAVGLLILVDQYQMGAKRRLYLTPIFDFYVQHMDFINNWNLVDLTAPAIIGAYLFDRDRNILQKWAKSKNLWTRRIAIIATLYFIRQKQFEDTFQIAEILLQDAHDLIHKAVGWMLREVGKRDRAIEEVFLKKHYKKMPRTMLRYAIERFPEDIRQKYLKGWD